MKAFSNNIKAFINHAPRPGDLDTDFTARVVTPHEMYKKRGQPTVPENPYKDYMDMPGWGMSKDIKH